MRWKSFGEGSLGQRWDGECWRERKEGIGVERREVRGRNGGGRNDSPTSISIPKSEGEHLAQIGEQQDSKRSESSFDFDYRCSSLFRSIRYLLELVEISRIAAYSSTSLLSGHSSIATHALLFSYRLAKGRSENSVTSSESSSILCRTSSIDFE